jgi:hypothetical protein
MKRKHLRECIGICQAAGLTVKRTGMRGRHMAVYCDEGFVTCPCTPSDHRWRDNLKATARKLRP